MVYNITNPLNYSYLKQLIRDLIQIHLIKEKINFLNYYKLNTIAKVIKPNVINNTVINNANKAIFNLYFLSSPSKLL